MKISLSNIRIFPVFHKFDGRTRFFSLVVGNGSSERSVSGEKRDVIDGKNIEDRLLTVGCRFSNVLGNINKPWHVKWSPDLKEDVKKWLLYVQNDLECNEDYFYVHIEKLRDLAEDEAQVFDGELVTLARETIDYLRKNRSWEDPILTEVYKKIVWRDNL